MNTRKKAKKRNGAGIDAKNKTIRRQVEEIEFLKKKVSNLEIDCEDKDEIIASIEKFRTEMDEIISDLRNKSDEYDMLMSDLRKMRKVMNQTVFKGRWRLVKWIMK